MRRTNDTSTVVTETQLGLLGTIIEGTSDGVMLLTPAVESCGPRVAFVNPALTRVTGLTRQELLAQPLHVLGMQQTDSETFDTLLEQVFSGEPFWSETTIPHKDGQTVDVEISLLPVASVTSEISHWIGFVRDVSEQRRRVRDLSKRANEDPLTGLPNRSLLLERLTETISESTARNDNFAFLMLDLNGFKNVNDRLGHEAGDELLREVAGRLLGSVRRSDTVARIGGDEFGFILDSTVDASSAEMVARKILRRLEAPLDFPIPTSIGAAIGITIFPDNGTTAGALMRGADVAMYEAKRSGRAVAVYDHELESDTQTRRTLAQQLSVGIELGQLIHHFQPIIDLRSRRVSRAEGLVRWNHPTKGLVNPGDFLPVAESSGLMPSMTAYLIDDAMRQWVDWRSNGIDVTLSVNISPTMLHDAAISELIAESLEKWDMPASKLEVEITETSILSDPEKATAVLSLIQSLGVALSLDDFGTGFSSLTNLRQIPFQQIKIDRSFVTDMLEEQGDAAIVHAMIDLAHALGRKVVAEGVENDETLEILHEWGCDFAQGYYISRPVSARELFKFVIDRS